MLPAIVAIQGEIDLHKWTPFRPLGFADEMQAGLLRGAIGFLGIALDTGANDVFPRCRATAIARDDVVEIQILPFKDPSAVLARIFVALKDIMAGELHFLLGQAVVNHQEDDPRHADAERDGMDGFIVGRVGGDIAPLAEIEGAKRAVFGSDDNLGLTLKEKGERAPCGTDIHGLPKPVQYENMLIKCSVHTDCGEIIRTDVAGQCRRGDGNVSVL